MSALIGPICGPPRLAQSLEIRAGGLPKIRRERNREVPTVHRASQHLGDRLAAGLTRVSRFHDALDPVPPRHLHRVAGLQQTPCSGSGQYSVDYRVLPPRQRQVGQVEALPSTLIPNTYHIRTLRASERRLRRGRPGSNSTFASGSSFLSSTKGDDGRR